MKGHARDGVFGLGLRPHDEGQHSCGDKEEAGESIADDRAPPPEGIMEEPHNEQHQSGRRFHRGGDGDPRERLRRDKHAQMKQIEPE